MSTAKIVLWVALGLVVLSGAAFGLSAALERTSRTATIVTDRVRRIVVHADAGDVTVRAGLTGDVVVQRRDAWLLDRPTVSERFGRGTLALTARCGRLRAILRCRSDLVVDAPPDVDVVVRTSAGDVDLRGLTGRADVATGSGDIRTERTEPITMHARTSAGDVDLDLFGQPARTVVHSDAGDVRVTVPYGPYHVDASTHGGAVRVEGVIRDDLAPQAIAAATDAGNVLVRAR